MHPIERLRYLARSSGEDSSFLAEEAALALGDLASEPMALVPACRRLLDAQPLHGVLWWLAASVLGAVDPRAAAVACAAQVAGDPTGDERVDALGAGAALAAEAASALLPALAERPDCTLRLYGSPYALGFALRELADGPAGGPSAAGYSDDAADEAVDGADLVLVEARAGSCAAVVLSAEGARLAAAGKRMKRPLWVVACVGRMLPEPLFEEVVRRAPPEWVLTAASVDHVVGPDGLTTGPAGLERADCLSVSALVNRR